MRPLTFLLCSLREDKDASHCAVPISTGLIKQIVNKTGNEDNPEHILTDFYGPKTTTESPWPYTTKDIDRYALLNLAIFTSFTFIYLCGGKFKTKNILRHPFGCSRWIVPDIW